MTPVTEIMGGPDYRRARVLRGTFNLAVRSGLNKSPPVGVYSRFMKMLLSFVVGAVSICAQDWTPRRIVAITDYLPLARLARIYGDVEIRCSLDANGSVLRAEVLSGHPVLKEQARQNALLWRFQNAGGAPGSNAVTLKYQYRLEGVPQDRAHTVFTVDLPNTIQIIAPLARVNP